MQVGVAGSTRARGSVQSLAVYPEDTRDPGRRRSRALAATGRLTAERHTAARSRRSPHASCSRSRPTAIAFHDLQRDFLLLRVERPEPRATHDLLAAYRALTPDARRLVGSFPPASRTSGSTCSTTCAAPATRAAVAATVSDLRYLAVRATGRTARGRARSRVPPAYSSIAPRRSSWLLRLFVQWGHLFADHATLGDLAATLASRTHSAPPPITAECAWAAATRGLPVAALGTPGRARRAPAHPGRPHGRG